MQYHYLHVIVPQGEAENPKKEDLFRQVLVNFQNTVKDKPISLEFFGYEQYTYCYVVVPDDLLETLEGLIYSTFPDAEIKPTKDYTSGFMPGKNAIAGTTLKLKFFDIYALKDYDTFTEDSQSGLFSVISKISSDEQVWVQIVVNPVNETAGYHFKRGWAMRFARIRQIFHIRDWFRAKSKGEDTIKAKRAKLAQEKYKQEPFDVVIRCAYVAEDPQLASRKLEAVKNSFYQFNSTDIQEFTAEKTTTSPKFAELYKKRSVSGAYKMGAKEIATLYHYPNADHVPHIVHVLAKKHEPPQDLPKRGTPETSFFGTTNYHNNFVEFGVRRDDRRRHLYTVGKSGSGKSKFLELLIKEDLEAGHGVGVLDPHGDLIDNIMQYIPEERVKDVVLFDPSDVENPIAFNPLENVGEEYKMQLTIGFIDIFKKLFGDNWSDRLEHVLRYTTLALLDSPNTTILSILKMLTDKNYRQKIISRIQDSVVKNFWVSEFAAWSEKFDAEAITPLLNKVGQLVSTNMIRNIIGQPQNKFNIREMMDGQKILLMKVSKGLLGEENSQILGAMVITKMYQAAMQRASVKEENRKDFYLYIDEFQNFATETFDEIISEARKYRLSLTLAHQYMGQLMNIVQKTVFGNIGTIVSFRVGAEDAKVLANEYTPIFQERDIINLGVREFYTKMSVNGEIREAFSGRTIDCPPVTNDFTDKIIKHSRKNYCTPKADVEKLLSKWDEAGEFTEDNTAPDMEQEFEEPLI
ncbi:type IV secretion system DNA-binding domain-containing protein [Patescibacteria group bacterium]|nr:type IV secretion system DNA-binding domain-containing protein [Patescibacteria group bacterium]MBU1683289.1 type IV secretion system DNA-binding domain-containing protein [Patescibacteria group bacterium]MBU1935147.1 type IV secretion system DNA-binding domain-containing protein [Patescibacteria group bacterium]